MPLEVRSGTGTLSLLFTFYWLKNVIVKLRRINRAGAYRLPTLVPENGQGCRTQTKRGHEELQTMTARVLWETSGCSLPARPEPSFSSLSILPSC